MNVGNMRKDALAHLVSRIRNDLIDADREYVQDLYRNLEASFEAHGVPLYEEVEYTIKVNARFRQEPGMDMVNDWVERAFREHFDYESCVFPLNKEFDDVFQFEVTRDG